MGSDVLPVIKPLSVANHETLELPAGGCDPSRFDWKEVWYPIYYNHAPRLRGCMGRDVPLRNLPEKH